MDLNSSQVSPDLDQLFAPVLPADDFDFERLAQTYNYRNVSDRSRLFVRLILKEIARRPQPVRLLDVGCGEGLGTTRRFAKPSIHRIRLAAQELWGVEPDTNAVPVQNVFDRHLYSTVEEADLPEQYFDIAYSYLVVEHVVDPVGFLKAIHRCLKPGGCFIFLTPSGKHAFARITRLLNRIHLDEFVLRMVRGRQKVEAYHYPVQYRMNDERAISAAAHEAGFNKPELVFEENEGPKPYFPGPLRPIYHLLRLKRAIYKNPQCLLNLYCRLTKPA